MSIQLPSQPSIAAALISLRGPTMADVLERLGGLSGLERHRRDGLSSAVRTFCRGLGKAPLDVSAEPRAVRDPIFGYPRRYVFTTRRDGTLSMRVSPDGRYLITPQKSASALAMPFRSEVQRISAP